MAHPFGEFFHRLRLQIHVHFGSPNERQVRRNGSLGAAVGLKHALEFAQRRFGPVAGEPGHGLDEGIGVPAAHHFHDSRLLERGQQVRRAEHRKHRFAESEASQSVRKRCIWSSFLFAATL